MKTTEEFLALFPDTTLCYINDSDKDDKKVITRKNFRSKDIPPTHGAFFTPSGCTGLRRKKENLKSIHAVYVDVDRVTTKEELLMQMADDGLIPTIINKTKNGFHCLWLFNETLGTEHATTIENINRRLVQVYDGDMAAIDITRLLRIPGTYHRKDINDQVLIETVFYAPENRYTLDEIIAVYPPVEEVKYENVLPTGVSHLSDDEVLAKMFKIEKAKKTYHNDLSFYDNNHSSADAGLLAYLAFWTGCNAEQMERIWLTSPLGQREKTQSRKENYRDVSIGKAIARCTETYTPPTVKSIKSTQKEEDDGDEGELARWQELEEQIDKVRLKILKEEDEQKRKSLQMLERALIKQLVEQYHVKLLAYHPHILYERTEEKVFWDYNDTTGIYDELTYMEVRNRVIKMLITQGLEAYATDKNVKEIITRYRGIFQHQGVEYDDFDKNNGLFHVKNGWVKFQTLELLPHTPDTLSRRVSNVDFIPGATCPTYDKFLNEDIQVADDAVRVIDQFSGLILTRDIKHEKMLTIVGKPGSGKSTLLNIWSYVLGDLTVQKSLTDLMGDRARFGGADFVGRTLCWFDEVDVKRNEAGSRLLKLITGTHHDIERKGINTTSYAENYLKCVLTANRLPLSVEQGLYRRMILIHFPRSFNSEGIQDLEILNTLKAESAGILNRMLVGLHDLWKMRTFTMIAGQDEAIEEYKTQSDTVAEFLDTFFIPSKEGIIPSKQLFEAYKSFADDRFVNTPQRFGQMLMAQPLNAFQLSSDRGSKGVRQWRGLTLKPDYIFKENTKTELEEICSIITDHDFSDE